MKLASFNEMYDHAVACGWITADTREEDEAQLRETPREHGMEL